MKKSEIEIRDCFIQQYNILIILSLFEKISHGLMTEN